ncbi:MAG TPA: DUF6174 domain-containing protein [Gemmatimonadaceae bacterium]|nr:DUF6174 domain-containing protein [Gemmatimonadaceae bacterium]
MSRPLSLLARRLSSLALFLVLPLAVGCEGIFDPSHNDERDLERARDRWYATNAFQYEITVDRRCACQYTGPIRMLVRDGTPVAAVDRYSGAQVPLSVLRYYPSVEELFDLIDEAIFGRSVNNVDVSYDHSYGFPRVTYIDYDRFYTDDDITYELREFRLR